MDVHPDAAKIRLAMMRWSWNERGMTHQVFYMTEIVSALSREN
jgi:hypothetical protein